VSQTSRRSVAARRSVERFKPFAWRTFLRLAFSTVALRPRAKKRHPNHSKPWSATVSQTSRRSVASLPRQASQKVCRAVQAPRMANVPATGFQHSRAPAKGKKRHPNHSKPWSATVSQTSRRSVPARRSVERFKPIAWRMFLRLAFSIVALRPRAKKRHPNHSKPWSATVSQTSRRSVASKKIGRAVQAHRMANVPATGFQHSRAPAKEKETSPKPFEALERDCVGDQSQKRGSQKIGRAVQALCMTNVPATGFQHSRAPTESKETSPRPFEAICASVSLWFCPVFGLKTSLPAGQAGDTPNRDVCAAHSPLRRDGDPGSRPPESASKRQVFLKKKTCIMSSDLTVLSRYSDCWTCAA